MKTQSAYITNFTVLRGIGALLVALGHYYLFIGRFLHVDTDVSLHQFYLAVDAFFIMSGFIMLHVYGENFKSGITRAAFKDFMIARFARTYPLHLFTLLIFVAIYYLNSGQFYIVSYRGNDASDPHAILTNVLLLQSFHVHKIYTWNIPSWSLSAEWWPYFTLPIIAFWLHSRKRSITAALLIFIPLAYCSVMYLLPKTNIYDASTPAPHDLDSTFEYGFIRGFAGFFTGIMVYVFYEKEMIRRIFRKDIVYITLLAAVVIALYRDVNDLLCIGLIAAFILSAGCNAEYISKFSRNRLLQFMGDISYSIYMNHLLIILFFLKGLRMAGVIKDTGMGYPWYMRLLIGASFLSAVILSSILTYYGIEVKCRKWINKKWSSPQVKTTKKAGELRLQQVGQN